MAKRPLGYWLKVPGVNSPTRNRVAALTHAGMIPQTSFVQVGVGEGVTARDPFGLKANEDEVQVNVGGTYSDILLKAF